MGGSCFVSVGTPENWDQVVSFLKRQEMICCYQEARPDQELSRRAMRIFWKCVCLRMAA